LRRHLFPHSFSLFPFSGSFLRPYCTVPLGLSVIVRVCVFAFVLTLSMTFLWPYPLSQPNPRYFHNSPTFATSEPFCRSCLAFFHASRWRTKRFQQRVSSGTDRPSPPVGSWFSLYATPVRAPFYFLRSFAHQFPLTYSPSSMRFFMASCHFLEDLHRPPTRFPFYLAVWSSNSKRPLVCCSCPIFRVF